MKNRSHNAFIVLLIGLVSEVHHLAELDRVTGYRDNVTVFTHAAGFESLHGTVREIDNFLSRKDISTNRVDSSQFLDDSFIRRIGREQ